MNIKQKTIKSKCVFSGKGLHTGFLAKLTLLPAKENTGIVFIRTDKNNFKIKAILDNVVSTERCTTIGSHGIFIKTVEHILAAITSNHIDNIIIEIDNEEVPILDGSCKIFCENIERIGIIEQKSLKSFFEIQKEIIYFDKDSDTEIKIIPSKNFSIEATIDYDSETLGIQKHLLENINDFNNEVADARTFCFLSELDILMSKNLIKGGDLNNAIVIAEKEINHRKLIKLAKLFNKHNIKRNDNGILNNLQLRYKNEPARHKVLDMIGDLSLIGFRIKGKIIAKKPGHKHNINFAKKIKEHIDKEMKKNPPLINFKAKPIYNKKEIENILPHREPFLFVDEIRELGEDYIIGVKYVKEEEEYFKGHFPGAPVMPGVLQLETMAQTGGVLILSTIEDPENYLTYFMKIDNAKFKQKVMPNDIIIFKLELISPIRRGLCHMHGIGYVNNKIAVEADLLAQIVRKD